MFTNNERPAETFMRIIKMARFCAALVGADVADPNYRINWVTCVVIGSIVGYFIFSVITILSLFEENPTYLLEASCMLGSVLQGVCKLFTGIIQTKYITATCLELEELFNEYQTKGSSYCVALNESCKRLKFVIKLVGLVYLLSTLGLVSVPFFVLLFTGKRHLMMHFLVPGLNVETTFGYFGTMAAHSVCLFCGSFGLFAGDLFAMIFFSQPYLFVDILKLKIKELNAYTEDQHRSNEMDRRVRDIIMWHKKFTNFNEVCNMMVYYIATVQITTSGISIVCTLYIILAGDWPGAYAYIWLAIEGLYMYCMLGTQTEIANDLFLEEIYNINWYNLPISQQKNVNIMLHKAQHPATIDVAGVVPLTVNTALQVTKSCYSIFMMMIQFLDDKK